MRIPPPIHPARFVRRLNRFAAEVVLDGQSTVAHLPNSGRLGELLVPGNQVYVAARPSPHRTTDYDLLFARAGRRLVSIDARLPNHLVAEAAEAGRLREVAGYERMEREVALGGCRLDFAFVGPGGRRLVEVKSVTLVEGGVALFPDAPTARGTKHLEVLRQVKRRGEAEALVLFVVQRPDARCFTPHEAADPRFAAALRRAAADGVVVRAYTCRVSTGEVSLHEPLPITLNAPARRSP